MEVSFVVVDDGDGDGDGDVDSTSNNDREFARQQSFQKSQGSIRLSIPAEGSADDGDDTGSGGDYHGTDGLASPNSSFLRKSQGSLRLNISADEEESNIQSSNSSHCR